MHLKGSCHCGKVSFELDTTQPYPFNRCYCSICRKTGGGGGYAINLGGDMKTMKITGEDNLSVYHAVMNDEGKRSSAERNFCKHCGSSLWLFSPDYPELVHPMASAIDTDLPIPPERTHFFLDSKANWVEPDVREDDKTFPEGPDESLKEWHERVIR